MNQKSNKVKRMLLEGKRVSAAWSQGISPIHAEILARAGFDMLLVDLEHGPGDISNLLSQVQAVQGYPTVPFARTMWNDFVHIKKVLDAGVYGVLIPHVNTKEEAIAAVQATKYPPHGIRGIAGSPKAAGFGNQVMDYLKSANDEIFVMTACETIQAVANIDSILEVEGLDGIFIGPMDLSTSMGHFGDPSQPEVQKAIREIEKKVLASGKVLCTVAGSWEDAQQKYEKGYQILISMSDTVTLSQVAVEHVKKFKNAYPQ